MAGLGNPPNERIEKPLPSKSSEVALKKVIIMRSGPCSRAIGFSVRKHGGGGGSRALRPVVTPVGSDGATGGISVQFPVAVPSN